MRMLYMSALLPTAGFMGALEAMSVTVGSPSDVARLAGLASVLGTLTVLIYRLGVWRTEMENTKHNIGSEVKAYRLETSANFDRLERRLDAIEHVLSLSSDRLVRVARRQALADDQLHWLEQQSAPREGEVAQ